MISHENTGKYLCCDIAGKNQSKLHKACKKEKVTLEYTTPHTTQLSGFIERIFAVIKGGVLEMLLNTKLNDTDQEMPWTEAVHRY